MIVTRMLARQLRAVLRRCVPRGQGGYRPRLAFLAGPDGLRIQLIETEVSAEYYVRGSFPPSVLALPLELLADVEGRDATDVELEAMDHEHVRARWQDASAPRVKEYLTPPGEMPAFPTLPARWLALEPRLLPALQDAALTAGKDNDRFGLARLQFRGAAGQIAATDGHQLLVQSGFTFGWKQDLLVPAIGVFGSKEVIQHAPVSVGRTDSHIAIRAGPWTFLLAIDKDRRFPAIERLLAAPTMPATTCRLTAADAETLACALPKMPGRDESDAPVTLDLNGQLHVRARGESTETSTEVLLRHSEVHGPPMRFSTNRHYVARALALGFREFTVIDPDQYVVCREDQRLYVFMPLGAAGALPPGEATSRTTLPPSGDHSPLPPSNGTSGNASPPGDAIGRIASPKAVCIAAPSRVERSSLSMPPTNTNGASNDPVNARGNSERPPTFPSLVDLVEEAEALKALLREGYTRASKLIVALKRQRQQNKLLASTMSALRQLRQIE